MEGKPRQRFPRLSKDRGTVAVIVAIMLAVFLSVAALAVDVGYMMVARNESQNAADAAALAGARQLGRIYQALTLAQQQGALSADRIALVNAAATAAALENKAAGVSIALNEADLKIGTWTPPFSGPTYVFPNAVQVRARRDATVNGPIATFFAHTFGTNTVGESAVATAALTAQSTGTPGLPFAIGEGWFSSGVCGNTIQWNKTKGSCTGWTTFLAGADADNLKGILNCLNSGGSNCIPATAVGDRENFMGGDVGSAFSIMASLFSKMKVLNNGTTDADNNSGTWTTEIPVADFPCGSNPNGSASIVGYTTITITAVDTSGGTVTATSDCNFVRAGRGGGVSFGGTLGSIPGLVQ